MRFLRTGGALNQESFRPEAAFTGGEFRLELFNKFHFDWNVDVAFFVSVAQKFADSRTSDLAIIASKFVTYMPMNLLASCEFMSRAYASE